MADKLENRMVEILPKCFFIQCKYPYCNGMLFLGDKITLVDPGYDPEMLEFIAKQYDVDVVVNTHFHIDHTYGNRYFPNAKICIHEYDAGGIATEKGYLNELGIDILENDSFGNRYFKGGFTTSKVDKVLKGGDMLDLGRYKFQVIHTPGHTHGHISLFENEHRLLISGDIDLISFGPWYGCASSSLDDFIDSVDKIKSLDPEIICAGHNSTVAGCPTGIYRENVSKKISEYKDVFSIREKKILDVLKRPMTLKEIADCQCIYGKIPKESLYKFEVAMAKQHLERLAKKEVIKNTYGVYYRI